MAGIEVAADALEILRLGILLVVEMGGDAVIRDPLGEQVDVAFFAGFVVNDPGGLFQIPSGLPVETLGILSPL